MDSAADVPATDIPGTATGPVGVLLVDDHRVFTDALRIGLDRQPDLRCVAVAHSAREALVRAARADVQVAVVDLDLPDAGGLDVVGALRERRPAVRTVVLTAHTRPDLADRALTAGAVGFLGKDGTLDRILDAVRTADASRPVVDPGLRPGPRVQLTHREHDVLRHLGQGLDAGRIAAALDISLYTTRDHIKALMAKLGVHSQLAAVVAAQRLGLISVGSRY